MAAGSAENLVTLQRCFFKQMKCLQILGHFVQASMCQLANLPFNEMAAKLQMINSSAIC